ncbi:Uma2 family endonuclease [Candidatus Poribacteria bacterium]|nr:Uma2 family endonuclease [Candidatus Poribacteria bacterium]
MASLPARTLFTAKEYITQERKAFYKSEYLDGQIFAMSGASRVHSLITSNISNTLYNQLVDSDCEVHSSDMRVQPSPIAYFYPDVVVACGEPRFEDDVLDTLLNPIVIVEVLSPSTAAYDRGEKFSHYRQLTSLRDYILVSQHKAGVEHHWRQDRQWEHTEFRALEDVLSLTSIGCKISLHDIYRRVNVAE